MSTSQQKGEQVNKTNNELQEILTHAIEEIRNEMGTDFDINKINLKDLENRTVNIPSIIKRRVNDVESLCQ